MTAQEQTPQGKRLKPLKISCTATDCENDLHCFLQKKRENSKHRPGPCRTCGADLIQWSRVHSRSLEDVSHTFQALKKELIRHELWHRDFDTRAVNHARRKGRLRLKEAVERRLRTSVGKAKNSREGRQTPFTGNTIFYAQHALAICCRRCMEYWHGIEMGRDLTEDELRYFAELISLYLTKRLPWLGDNPERVPRASRAEETSSGYSG